MNMSNINLATEWFEVLQTTERSQTAVMRPTRVNRRASMPKSAVKNLAINKGDVVIIPPRVKHKFTDPSDKRTVTFNVYCPPEYSPDEKG
jgi:oxalate decarboxylase/phosphoglucose isomerase-like protein (cupin superfamily)